VKDHHKIALYEMIGITAIIVAGGYLAATQYCVMGGVLTGFGLILMWIREIMR
jgi:hypothetical protein